MKSLYLLLISCGTALSVFAQVGTLTIQVNGNRNKQLVVDGKSYELYNSSGTQKNDPVQITDLKAGTHKVQFVRTNQNKVTAKSSKTINLRSGYDLLVTVNNDGSVSTKETKISTTANTNTGATYGMDDQKLATLVSNVKKQWKTSTKMSLITKAFNDTKNTFTTDQAGQLIVLVNGESNRLQLAKLAYRGISDPANFSDIEELLSSTAGKNELRSYVQAHTNSSTGTYTAKGAMTDANFNTLMKNVKNQWRATTRTTMINNAFKDTKNYFTTDQAGQLITLVTPENDRLMLAKAAYRGIVDTARFTDMYELLNTQESRNELAQYVYTYNGGVGTIYNNSTYRTPMSDASYNDLYNNIKGQWLPFSKMSALTTAFADANNYFTTSQARQLIMLVSDEDNRLELAKSSYRNITDPANFSQLYDVLPTQAKRDELAAYVKNYR